MTLVHQGFPDEIRAIQDWERRMRKGFGLTEEQTMQAGAQYMPQTDQPTHLYRQGPPTHLCRPRFGLKMDYPPGVHALIAFRNLHRCTGVLDDSGQAVQE